MQDIDNKVTLLDEKTTGVLEQSINNASGGTTRKIVGCAVLPLLFAYALITLLRQASLMPTMSREAVCVSGLAVGTAGLFFLIYAHMRGQGEEVSSKVILFSTLGILMALV